ncbi:MAG: hypothetical protein IKF91_05690, partial [Bacilli bacterium]|nr:hypothetical protein [Bacilli bacterium]
NQNQDILDVIIENEDELINNTLYEKGISQGIEQTKIESAKKMLEDNLDISLISKYTNLSEKDILALKDSK